MTPTQEQKLIIEANDRIVKVNAFAGTGKTSTLVERAKVHKDRTLYLAFNKSVAEEATLRFPTNVTCKTQHSLAWAAIIGKRHNGYTYTLGKLSIFNTSKFFRTDYYTASLVHKTLENFCCSSDSTITKDHAAVDVIGKFDFPIEEKLTSYASQVWGMMIKADRQFPMTHSGYLKLFQLSKPKLGYPVIFLDEAQDTNPVVHDIVLSQAQHGSQIVLVGDKYQQIYQFRGAVDALDKVEAPSYYLTQSFRFGSQVAGVANHLLNGFFSEERPLQGLGAEGTIGGARPENYTFLARTNAFLFAEACNKAGRCKMFASGSGQYGELPLFQAVMDVYNLYAGNKQDIKDIELKNFDTYKDLYDFVQTGQADPEWSISTAVVEKYRAGVPAQVGKIRSSLTSTAADAQVVLVTAHRAKGMEWDTVVLGSDYPELFTEDGDLKEIGPDRLTQVKADEINLLYVASTRAKKNLITNTQLDTFLSYRESATKPVAKKFEVILP